MITAAVGIYGCSNVYTCSYVISLYLSQPLGRGYIAIVLTKLEEADTACSKLLTEDEYQNYLTKTSI